MPTPIQGRYGRFSVDGVPAFVESFSAEFSTDRIEITGWEDQSNTANAAGVYRTSQRLTDGTDKCVATVKGYVDADAMPASFGFTQGGDLSDVYLFLEKYNYAKRIYMAAAKVFSINYQANVHDKIMFEIKVENVGPFIGPT